VTDGNASMTVQSIKTPSVPVEPARRAAAPDLRNKMSPNLTASVGPPPAETNRKALERDAGRHAAKLLLGSIPGNAEAFVNDLTVGRTPLLLNVPPGRYKVGMHGDHQEWGDETIGALPDQTQVVLIHLKPRYPSNITLH
jgi:PEGA domain